MNQSLIPFHSAHAHTSSCWWDHTRPGWVCDTSATTHHATQDARSGTDRSAGPVDVRDMVVVHTAMLREFRLLGAAVAAVPDGDRARAHTIDGHLGMMCDLLHHHHEGEDELVWPLLRDRLPARDQVSLDVAEAQHAGLDQALADTGAARRAWVESASAAGRDALARSLEALLRLLTEHLEAEERELLPLASAHLTDEEWHAVGEAGAASVPKKLMPLVFGMFAYEGDPEVLAGMLAAAPLVPRLVVPRVAPRVYARRALQVYGTRTP